MKKILVICVYIICCTPYAFGMDEKLNLYINRWNRQAQELEQNGLKELEKRQASPEEIKKFQEGIEAQKDLIQKISAQ